MKGINNIKLKKIKKADLPYFLKWWGVNYESD